MAVSEIPNAKRQIPKNSQRRIVALAMISYGRRRVALAFEHWRLDF
jgi:hypothetical protein